MNEIAARASAIQELLDSGAYISPSQPVAEALLSCCSDLVLNGEPKKAIALINSARALIESVDEQTAVRLSLVHARALTLAGQFRISSEVIAALPQQYASLDRDTSFQFRIIEASNLWGINQADEAVEKLEIIRSELLAFPDSYLLGWSAYQLASAEIIRGRYQKARHHALEAIVSSRRCGNKYLEADALMVHSLLERSPCRWASAREAAESALAISDITGSLVSRSHALRSLAIIAWKRGELANALRLVAEHNNLCEKTANERLASFGQLLHGLILLHAGDFAQAETLFAAAEANNKERSTRPALLVAEFVGDIYLEQGNAESALAYYQSVWPEAIALLPNGDIVAELRRRLAECFFILGDFDSAYTHGIAALEHARQLGDRYEEAATYRVLAMISGALHKIAETKEFFDQGFAYFEDIETPYEWGKLWLAYGDWISKPESAEYYDRSGAIEAYRSARYLFQVMGARAQQATVEGRIARLAPDSKEDSTTARRAKRTLRGANLDALSVQARNDFGIITRDQGLLRTLDDVRKLARSSSPILILGESGTGKELVAHGLHALSGRSGSFIPLNCAALPREIVESELFGHMAGSFTGATRDRPGLFEVCTNGTAFLDEIAEMSIELQSRLLRVLELGEVRRVGAPRPIRVDARIVAATNKTRFELENGAGFRTDLYYRLAHAVIELPPLRRRPGDVDMLLDIFLAQFCFEEGKEVTFSAEARTRLREYAWPGNVRQLRAMVRRVVLLASSGQVAGIEDLQLDDLRRPSSLTEELEQSERARILEAMRKAGNSRAEAARTLGMPRTTLINKLKRYGLI